MIALTLPWPPSVNHYWRHQNGRHHISDQGVAFRIAVRSVVTIARTQTLSGRLAVEIQAYPPDRRSRDLDNALKALLDALTHAGLWLDDEQIDDLRIVRKAPEAPGALVVKVSTIDETTARSTRCARTGRR